MFDVLVNLLNFESAKEQAALPGFLAQAAPRRPARGREGDILALMVVLTGSTPMTPEQLQDLTQQLAARYFATPGTVTAGIRVVAESLNNYILNRNLRNAKEGWQAAANLGVAVIRRDSLYLGQAGASHAYVVSRSETQEYFDPDVAARSLGTSRALSMRYSQAVLRSGDMVFLCPAPPAAWETDFLAGSTQTSLDVLKRRLLQHAGADLKLGLLQVQEGKGNVISRRWSASSQLSAVPAEDLKPVAPETAVETPPTSAWLVGIPPVQPEPVEEDNKVLPPIAVPSPEPMLESPKVVEVVEQPALPRFPAAAPARRPVTAVPPPPRRIGPKVAQGGKKLVGFTAALSGFWSKVGAGLNSLTAKVLPGTAQKVPALSSSALWFIAIAVPLVVVAIATTVYLRSSGSEQQTTYLAQANQFAIKAESSTDKAVKLNSWTQSRYWLEKSEQYGVNDETRQLRLRIENGLDALENISRLDLNLALNDTFTDKVKIVQMAYSGNDLYALDQVSGRVLRLLYTNNGYSLDSKFNCDPSQMASAGMTPLVDLVALPLNNPYEASIAAIDLNGFLLYCSPDTAPSALKLPTPGQGWGTIVSMTLNRDILYVLDTKNNAVWRFEGNGKSQFEKVPTLFFDQKVPARMTEMIDLAVTSDELFLLRNTGGMVTCTYSDLKAIKLTECKDPAKYTDIRTERSSTTVVMEETGFTQMQTSSNGFSIYVLDAKGKSVYSFSMKLNLVKILFMRLADGSSLANKELTALAIGPGDLTFAAFGDEVYSARIK